MKQRLGDSIFTVTAIVILWYNSNIHILWLVLLGAGCAALNAIGEYTERQVRP